MLTLALTLFAQLLTPEETKAVNAVIDAAVKAGFPDGTKASVYTGRASVSAVFNPSKETAPLPSDRSTVQMTVGGGRMRYGYAIDGLHVKLADGTWLLALDFRFKPREDDTVNTDALTPVDLSALTEAAAKAVPFDAETRAREWLDALDPAARERTVKAFNRYMPVAGHLQLAPLRLAPAIVLFARAGWKDAVEAGLWMADSRRPYRHRQPWIEPDSVFDPTGAYGVLAAREKAWREANPRAAPESPAVALRRALYTWAERQIMNEDAPPLAIDAAAALCKAMVDPGDPQGMAARVDRMVAAARLPVIVAEGADLATRLASWEARPRAPRMVVSSGSEGLSMSTTFSAPPPAYVPKKEDLDGLVALLADERPSRLLEYAGTRTLGDNAWRALAILLKVDPRALAGHPNDNAWTPDERRAAARAFQDWWKDHRGEHADK